MAKTAAERQDTGRQGEKLARKYLTKLGYKHLKSNYRVIGGEIDLIMRDDRTLVFVEVKARRSEDFVAGEQVVHFGKQRRLIFAAKQFVVRYKLHDYPCRFDVVIIIGEGRQAQIRHYGNAFKV